jgi:hypothetical protein
MSVTGGKDTTIETLALPAGSGSCPRTGAWSNFGPSDYGDCQIGDRATPDLNAHRTTMGHRQRSGIWHGRAVAESEVSQSYRLSGRSLQQQSGLPHRATTSPRSTWQPQPAHRMITLPSLEPSHQTPVLGFDGGPTATTKLGSELVSRHVTHHLLLGS